MIRISSLLAILWMTLTVSSAASPLHFQPELNVLTFGSMTVVNSSIGGSVAVGGSANFVNFALANGNNGNAGLQPSSDGLNLIVAGSLSMTYGELKQGSGTYAGAASLTGVGVPNGSVTQAAASVNFGGLQTEALEASAEFAAMTANGSVNLQYGGLRLTGKDDTLNVFNVNAADLAKISELRISVPDNAAVLINVVGLGTSFSNAGLVLNDSPFSAKNPGPWGEVLWNFVDATSFSIQGVQFAGSILAPKTALTLGYGQVNGQIVANTLTSFSGINNFAFNGSGPGTSPGTEPEPVPEPTTLSMAAAGVLLVLVSRFRHNRRVVGAA
jgi:choice-of-anchor A domain-containing protein